MNETLPPLFLERLKEIVPAGHYDNVVARFSQPNPISVRVNTLKTTKKDVLCALNKKGVSAEHVPWMDEAIILKGVDGGELGKMDLISEGHIYRQGLSSMLPAVVLDPKPGENVLDMCAAPGSKTTQMAARMANEGSITAIDVVRGRYYKLRTVTQLMGAENIAFHLMDARRFRAKEELFDKILVDAPCSSEGRFKAGQPKTLAYWSPRKIKEMVRKQRGLLLSASRLLRPGGTLVYSTCTFSPEENENVVSWLLRKTEESLAVQDICLDSIPSYPAVTSWKEKEFNPQVKKCFRVLPSDTMEGFFLAQFKKNQ